MNTQLLFVIFALSAILRNLIPGFDLLLFTWLLAIPKENKYSLQYTELLLFSGIITSFFYDTPLGITPLVIALFLALFLPLSPGLVTKGIDKGILWGIALFFIVLSVHVLSHLFELQVLVVEVPFLRKTIITVLISLFVMWIIRQNKPKI